MTIFLSTGPVISTRRSSKSFGSGATCSSMWVTTSPLQFLAKQCIQTCRACLVAALPDVRGLRQEAWLLAGVIARLHCLAPPKKLLQARSVVARQFRQKIQGLVRKQVMVARRQHSRSHSSCPL